MYKYGFVHSIDEIATGEMIAELIARGVDMASAIQQMKAGRRQTSDKVIRYPTQAERLYGTG